MPRDDGAGLRAVDLSAAPAFRRDVEAVHGLGARATAELVAELILMLPVDQRQRALDRLAAYRGIPADKLAAAGGDKFSAIPLRVVPP